MKSLNGLPFDLFSSNNFNIPFLQYANSFSHAHALTLVRAGEKNDFPINCSFY